VFLKLIAKLLAYRPVALWVINVASKRPYYHLPGYMQRWWLFNPDIDEKGTKQYEWIPFSIRVHHIIRADRDKWPHCHPGRFIAFVMIGWYENKKYLTKNISQVWTVDEGQYYKMSENEYHWVSQVSDPGPWTLFVMWKPKVRKPGSWGFLVRGKYVPWRQYLKSPDDPRDQNERITQMAAQEAECKERGSIADGP
jgi:hypothetical protein